MRLPDLLREVGERGILLHASAVQWLAGPGAPLDAVAELLLAPEEPGGSTVVGGPGSMAGRPLVWHRADLESRLGEAPASTVGTPAGQTPANPPGGTARPLPSVPGRARNEEPSGATRDFRPAAASAAADFGALLLEPPRVAPPPIVADRRMPPVQAATLEIHPTAPAFVGVEPRPKAFDHRADILSDITGRSNCEGTISDFTRYFNDRLQKGRKLLRQRRNLVGTVPIKAVRPGAATEFRLIGLVSEIRKTKNGHRLFVLEDDTGSVPILAHAGDAARMHEAETLIEDEVIGVIAKPARNGELLILQDVVRPDVPTERARAHADRDACVAFISDTHFGSKTFLTEDWARFERYLALDDPDPYRRDQARRVKYLVVNGDVADGVGIFPGQEDELAITDAYAQYDEAGRAFSRIQASRPDLKIFLIPGNHDLVRPAEPQPAFQEKYRRLFPKEAVFLGNPVRLRLEGVEVLAYHGRSFDDWHVKLGADIYSQPLIAMRQMMQRRHLAPVYGLRTPIAPEHEDYLFIDTVPDVFTTGHVHSAGIDTYRGVMMINSSCWQSQTSYQKMHGFTPVPGRAVVYDLARGISEMMSFHTGAAGVDRVGLSALGKPDPRVDPGAVA